MATEAIEEGIPSIDNDYFVTIPIGMICKNPFYRKMNQGSSV